MLTLLVASTALAYTNPDRPSVSMGSSLIEPDSIEMEVGGFWHRDNGGSTPLRLKYAYSNAFEVRLEANPLGLAGAGPGLVAGAKIPIARGDAGSFTGWLGSALPIATGESWVADAMLLYGKGVEGFGLTVNIGIRVDGTGLVGIPLVATLSLPSPAKVSWFVEGATVFNDGFGSSVVDGGILYSVTSQLTADVGAGYTIDDGAPFIQAGATFNFGQLK